MVKSPKQEPRKTAWRGISVKADTRPTSYDSTRTSLSWEKREPLSPLSEVNPGIITAPSTPKSQDFSLHQQESEQQPDNISPSNSTAVSSTKSRPKKEKLSGLGSLTKSYEPKKKERKSERLATLGSLTKPYDPTNDKQAQKENERKQRKEREKIEKKERKEQEKLEKQLKEQQRKELKLLKEKEKKERKSKSKSSIFSRSSKSSSSAPSPIDIEQHAITDDKPKSPLERRSFMSFGRHSIASLTSKPSNASNVDIGVQEPVDSYQHDITDDSSTEEFVDFVDSHMSIRSEQSNNTNNICDSSIDIKFQSSPQFPTEHQDTTSSLQSSLQTRTQNDLQEQQHEDDAPISSTNNNNTLGNTTNHSMFYILNSLQDAGKDLEDDDLLDDVMVNKMEATQQRVSFSHRQYNELHGEQFDQHIQALEILASGTSASPPPNEPLPPLPTDRRRQSSSQRTMNSRLSMDSNHSPSLTGRFSVSSKMSRNSSISNSSYDTVAPGENHHFSPTSETQHPLPSHSPLASPYGIPAISEEELLTSNVIPCSPTPGPLEVLTATNDSTKGHIPDSPIDNYITPNSATNIDNVSDNDKKDISDENELDDSDSCSFESTEIPDPYLFPSDDSDDPQQIDNDSTGESATRNQPATKEDEIQPESVIMDHPIMTNDLSSDKVTHKMTSSDMNDNNDNNDRNNNNNHQNNCSNDINKEKSILDEALKVRTTDNISGRQVPVMQVNINHDTHTENHPSLVAPMSAIIEANVIPTTGSQSMPIIQNPSSPIAAAAAVTASKRSSLVSNKRNSSSSIPTSLDQQSPSFVDSPTPLSIASSTPGTPPTEVVPSSTATKTTTSTATTTMNTCEDCIMPNLLDARQQEEADKPVRQGMVYLFGNKFTKAMSIFKSKADSEPLYALGMGSMLFLKAMMTYNENDVEAAMKSLSDSFTIATTQAELSEEKPSFEDAFSSQFSSLMASTKADDDRCHIKTFMPNGILRAHVIKAESCLLMGLLQLTQENMTGYLKCGLNLRKACSSYTLVWNEYQRMGEQVNDWMDCDTISAVQFGVGTLHLLLSSLPTKIVKIFSGLTWKTDKSLGFSLLKSAMTGKGTRSTFASLVLLSYYSLLSSLVPSLYAQDSIQPTIECLVEAQKSHPKSCFFLYYAARISRVARNVGLSTQSFTMATASTRRGAWAEVAMKHTVAYEVGLNHAMQLDWDTSAAYFEQLCCARDWSPAFCQYFVGACHEMLGQRQEAMDCFDEVPVLSHQQHHRKSLLDNFVQVKVERYQCSDYRDLDSSLPGLELLLLLNAFASMEETYLQRCLVMIQETCQLIKMKHSMGILQLDDLEDYNHDDNDDDRVTLMIRYTTLLLLKASVLNALSRCSECVVDLDWVLKRKHLLETEEWLLPFVYWEVGVTQWGIGNQKKSREMWQLALSCTKYDFEFRMASRIHLALGKCDELGILEPSGSTYLNGRKRL